MTAETQRTGLLEDTIIANNLTGPGNASDLQGDITTSGANLVEASSGTVAGASPLTVDPNLGPLADNGGLTKTMIPLSGAALGGAVLVVGSSPPVDHRGAPGPPALFSTPRTAARTRCVRRSPTSPRAAPWSSTHRSPAGRSPWPAPRSRSPRI